MEGDYANSQLKHRREGDMEAEVGCRRSAIDSSNIGFQLLKKCGWKEGTGLGASEQRSGSYQSFSGKSPVLRHVHSSDIYELVTEIEGPAATANLNNLRSIGRFLVPKSWNKSLPHIPSISKSQLTCQDEDDGKLIHDLLSKLSKLLSVRLDNFYPPQNIIDLSTSPSYENIHTLFLSGYKTLLPSVQIAKLPPNLTKITLSSFSFLEDPMPTLEKLCSLKSLEMKNIRMVGDTMVCSSGGFPRLQNLKLDDVLTIIIWNVEYGAFPMLKYLYIRACNLLNALPDLYAVRLTYRSYALTLFLFKIKKKSGGNGAKSNIYTNHSYL